MKAIGLFLFGASLWGATPDREIGQWIASQGGKFTADSSGRIVAVDLASTWITDSDLSRVAQLSALKKLNLSQTRVTDSALEYLRPLKNVTEFNCYYAQYLTDDGIAHITGWKNLERLNLRGSKVTSTVFGHIAQWTNLRELDLAFTQIDDEGFENLSSLTKLEKLAIGGNRISGTGLSSLKLLPALVDLDVGGMQWVDSGMWGLSLTETNLQQIATLTQLKRLSLSGANLTDRGTDKPGQPEAERKELKELSVLAKLVNLEVLDLSRTPVSDTSLAPLEALPKLREIRLGMAKNIDDGVVPVLAKMKRLKTAYLAGTPVTEQAREQLQAR